jgi:hypothetical protein
LIGKRADSRSQQEPMLDPNNWYQSKVRLRVASVAGGVMAFGGGSGGRSSPDRVSACAWEPVVAGC